MLRFHAQNFVRALNGIKMLETLASRENQDPGFAKIVSEVITDLQPITKSAGLVMTEKAVARLNKELANDHINLSIVNTNIADIRRRMDDELEDAVFFTVTKHKDKLAAAERSAFGGIVALSFPSAVFDIEEAGKCLALDRSTACVFHLMRVLEVALVALAHELKVTATTDNWNSVLTLIENEIRSRKSKGPNAVWSQEDETFFADVMTNFFAFKNAWRNHTMHKRVTYTEEKASDIYDAVRAFMKHISERIREPNSILS